MGIRSKGLRKSKAPQSYLGLLTAHVLRRPFLRLGFRSAVHFSENEKMANSTSSGLIKNPLIKLPAVLTETQTSRSFVYAGVKNGTFPKPLKIGKRAVAWTTESIDTWITAKIAGGSHD